MRIHSRILVPLSLFGGVVAVFAAADTGRWHDHVATWPAATCEMDKNLEGDWEFRLNWTAEGADAVMRINRSGYQRSDQPNWQSRGVAYALQRMRERYTDDGKVAFSIHGIPQSLRVRMNPRCLDLYEKHPRTRPWNVAMPGT